MTHRRVVKGAEPPLDRARARKMLDGLGRAIASGKVTPDPLELEALLVVLYRHGHVEEAARVRRWLGGVVA